MKKLVVTVEPSSDGLWARIENPELMGATSATSFGELEDNLKEFISLNIQLFKDEGKEVPVILENYVGFKYQVHLEEYLDDLPLKMTSLAEFSGLNRSLVARYASGNAIASRNQFSKIVDGVRKAGNQIAELSY